MHEDVVVMVRKSYLEGFEPKEGGPKELHARLPRGKELCRMARLDEASIGRSVK